jgi:hypothetical protein
MMKILALLTLALAVLDANTFLLTPKMILPVLHGLLKLVVLIMIVTMMMNVQ